MLKKTVKYTDFNGNTVEEDIYFHISKADIIEMEMSHQKGLKEHLEVISAGNDRAQMFVFVTDLILMAYGKRSEDGSRFIKSAALREEFQSSPAYSEVLLELTTDAAKAAEFVNGIVPPGFDKEIEAIAARQRAHPSALAAVPAEPQNLSVPRILTQAEVLEMDGDELKSGLATGRYKLS